MNLHEEEFIQAFIIPSKRDRYLILFATKKGRRKLTSKLNHNHEMDTRFLHRLPPQDHSVDSILRLLKQRGAPASCSVIASCGLDGQQMDLEDALAETVCQGIGTVISCIPGKLGYFEAEDPGERYLIWQTEAGELDDTH